MTKAEEARRAKAERARQLIYKRPALATMGYEQIQDELNNIVAECDEVRYFLDTEDGSDLLESVIEDEDDAFEFKMAFSDLDAQAERLLYEFQENVADEEEYNDCTVGLIGNRYDVVGYDDVQEDYFSLTTYEAKLGETEAGRRFMRHTKSEMVSIMGQCVGVLMAFHNIRYRYDYLKATMDIIRDENVSVLKQIREIEAAYERAVDAGAYSDEARAFDAMVQALPERMWIE